MSLQNKIKKTQNQQQQKNQNKQTKTTKKNYVANLHRTLTSSLTTLEIYGIKTKHAHLQLICFYPFRLHINNFS